MSQVNVLLRNDEVCRNKGLQDMNRLNEAQNDTSDTIPTDAKGFSAWRNAQTFATTALANKAWRVEADYALEAKLTNHQPKTREGILKFRADFIAEYEALKLNANA